MKKALYVLFILLIASKANSQMLFIHSKDSVNGQPKMEAGFGGWIKLSLIYDRLVIETTSALNPM